MSRQGVQQPALLQSMPAAAAIAASGPFGAAWHQPPFSSGPIQRASAASMQARFRQVHPFLIAGHTAVLAGQVGLVPDCAASIEEQTVHVTSDITKLAAAQRPLAPDLVQLTEPVRLCCIIRALSIQLIWSHPPALKTGACRCMRLWQPLARTSGFCKLDVGCAKTMLPKAKRRLNGAASAHDMPVLSWCRTSLARVSYSPGTQRAPGYSCAASAVVCTTAGRSSHETVCRS